jgi:hypothetical protein
MFAIYLKPFIHSAVVITTITVVAAPVTGSARHSGPQMQPVAQILPVIMEDIAATMVFQQRVSDYVTMHRLLEGPVPAPQVSTDMRTVRAAMHELAVRIQAARKDARQGDIFTPEVARMFHRRIASCLAQEEINALLADQRHGELKDATPQVNGVWPVTVPFDFVPPQLLATLPHLPPELQYRIIGRSLVLWDHHANLIVDVLPGALAPEGQLVVR